MKNLSLTFIFFALILLISSVSANLEVNNVKSIKKAKTQSKKVNVLEKLGKKTLKIKTKSSKNKTKKSTKVKGIKTIKNKKISKSLKNVIKTKINKTEIVRPTQTPEPVVKSSTPKSVGEEKTGESNNLVLYGTAALIVAAVGGLTYRNQVKKNMNKKPTVDYSYHFREDLYGDENMNYDDQQQQQPYDERNNYLSYSNNSYAYISDKDLYNNNATSVCRRNDTEVIFENEEEKLNVVTLPTNHAYKAVLPWNPRCVDEIQLNCGDLVCIKECYQDGYSLGRNLTSRFDGIFPTCCLANIGSKIDEGKVQQWRSVGMYSLPKRTIKPTKKAKRASRGISLLTIPDWSKKLESLKLDSPAI